MPGGVSTLPSVVDRSWAACELAAALGTTWNTVTPGLAEVVINASAVLRSAGESDPFSFCTFLSPWLPVPEARAPKLSSADGPAFSSAGWLTMLTTAATPGVCSRRLP